MIGGNFIRVFKVMFKNVLLGNWNVLVVVLSGRLIR